MKRKIIDVRIQELNGEIDMAESQMEQAKKEMASVIAADNETIVDCMAELSKEFNKAYDWKEHCKNELKVLETIKREMNQ